MIATIGTELFSEATQKWVNIIGAAFGYKLLLLTILLLIAILVALLIHRSTESQKSLMADPKNFDEKRIRLELEKILGNLSADEKKLLCEFIDTDVKTKPFFRHNATVSGLTIQKILIESPNDSLNGSANYTLVNWVWEILKKNPSYLK